MDKHEVGDTCAEVDVSRVEGYDVASVEPDDSQVGQELNELRKSLDHAGETQQLLEKKLRSVLMPEPELNESGSGEVADEDRLAPLAEEIRTARHRINQLSMCTKSLLEALAV